MANFRSLTWITSDGLSLYARDYRPQTVNAKYLPVVCLHGLTRNSQDFEDVAERLVAAGRRVIAVDFRGRGKSAYDPNPKNYHPDIYARDIDGLLQAQGIMRAHFIGTSLGGIVIAALSRFNMDRIASAVLNDIGPEVNPVGLARIASYAGQGSNVQSWDDAVAYVQKIGAAAYPSFQDTDWQRMARRTFRADQNGDPILNYDTRVFRPVSSFGLKLLSMVLGFRLRRLAWKRPTLILRGGISDLLSAETVLRLKAAVPTLLAVEVPNVGHAPTLAEAEAQRAVDGFLMLADVGAT